MTRPCTALIIFTDNAGRETVKKLTGNSPSEVFEQICSEGIRLELQNSAPDGKVRKLDIKLERDE